VRASGFSSAGRAWPGTARGRSLAAALVHLPGGKAEVNAACVLAGYGITAPGLKFDEYAALDADHNTPRDTWDKLLPAKVEKVARLAFPTALEVAERQGRPRFKQSMQDDPLMLLQGAVR
jgi:hypothetical protein